MEALLNDFGHVFLLELMMACAITLCGCYTTYTDIHFRHIPNWASWGLLAVGLVSQGLFWIWGQVELDRAGLVFLVGFAVSYLLYIYGFWAPGDAKLFWAFVLVLPPTFFPSTSLSSFNAPIWALLLNALVLTCFVLLALWAVLRPSGSAEAKEGLDASRWLYLGLELAGLIGLVLGLGTFLRAEAMTFVEVVVAVLVLYLLVDHFVPRSYRLTLVLPGLILGGYTVLESGEWPIYLGAVGRLLGGVPPLPYHPAPNSSILLTGNAYSGRCAKAWCRGWRSTLWIVNTVVAQRLGTGRTCCVMPVGR